MAPPEISVQEAAARLVSPTPPRLVDVREAHEWDLCHIQGAILVPLSEFAERASELLVNSEVPLLMLCHHGIRSAHATAYLLSHGYRDVTNIRGGIDAWSLEIDSAVPRY